MNDATRVSRGLRGDDLADRERTFAGTANSPLPLIIGRATCRIATSGSRSRVMEISLVQPRRDEEHSPSFDGKRWILRHPRSLVQPSPESTSEDAVSLFRSTRAAGIIREPESTNIRFLSSRVIDFRYRFPRRFDCFVPVARLDRIISPAFISLSRSRPAVSFPRKDAPCGASGIFTFACK